MYVIGTAGHVDHGKSTLVQALTGIDPDRLAEEKAREMTIDLGFAWLTLGDENQQTEVGVVDVPGHRDFIENMLAGVGGIDVALFVVAADEGVMPQTREHLAILDLLEIRDGVIALTKADLVADDPDWLELVILDVGEAVSGTILDHAPILPVSGKTGAGLEDLRSALWERLVASPPRPDNGRPRLPVDRVFSLSGFGTVVTGTLTDGHLNVGDPIEIQPAGLAGRIRGLQTHKTKLETAKPGSRVAINISGLDRTQVNRGDIIAAPGILKGTILFDAHYKQLLEAEAPLKHNMEVKLFVGASEVVARARVLGQEQIEPGTEGWLQLATSESVAVLRGDRFILRRPSPGATFGGGKVLDPFPGRRHRRFKPETLSRLRTLSAGTPDELLIQALQRIEPASRSQLMQNAGLDQELAAATLEQLLADNQIIKLDQQLITHTGRQRLIDKSTQILAAYHTEYPLRVGIPREELRSRLRLKPNVFNPFLATCLSVGVMAERGAVVHSPGHTIEFSAVQQKRIDDLLRQFSAAGINSPSVKDAKTAVGEDVYFALVDLEKLKPVSADVVYAPPEYAAFTGQIKAYLQANGRINAAQTRDMFGTSRKYAIALLEHLDDIKWTRRVGDDRVLVS